MSITIELKNKKIFRLLDHDKNWFKLSVKMEELSTIFKAFSRSNMTGARILVDSQPVYTFKNVEIESCTLEFSE